MIVEVQLYSSGSIFGAYTKQLLAEVEHDIMNYQNRGLCFDNS